MKHETLLKHENSFLKIILDLPFLGLNVSNGFGQSPRSLPSPKLPDFSAPIAPTLPLDVSALPP
jgi:hypothetical protein